jgi:asparagine synthase (glutamine-hydrolysing)
MCGIAGVLNHHLPGAGSQQPVPLSVLKRMIYTLRHRGPDEFGIYQDDRIGMANARLSIVDLEGGSQPISNEDGSVWVVYNGEIFNDSELRRSLIARGHRFATHCDTETIVHLYEEYGPACLHRLNGQFAIAIWNKRDQSLFLARDRVGVRPLFYTVQNGRLVFASEIKAILTHPEIHTSIDPQALKQVFTYWSVLSPRTVYSDIFEVPPGHSLLCRDGQIQTECYWTCSFAEEDGSRRGSQNEDDYLQEFEALLTDAVRIRLRADVPVGAYLSGGIDSSTVCALIRKQNGAQLDTFSIAFEDPRFDESEYQLRMADELGTGHHGITCSSAEIGRAFPEVIRHTETPVLRTAPVPLFLLSQLVHEWNYKVVLTGEGADEFLGGYDLFKEMKIRRFLAREPDSQVRWLLLKKLYPDIARISNQKAFLTGFFGRDLFATQSPFYSHQIRWFNSGRLVRFFDDASVCQSPEELIQLPYDQFRRWAPLAQAQYLEIVTFLSPYLLSSQGDRPSMAHSVEGRYPFLDPRLIEFCNCMPAEMKLRGLNEKYLLRKLGQRLLPDGIWKRSKRPYRAPIQPSFYPANQPLDYVQELLDPDAVRRFGFFNPAAVKKLACKAASPALLSEMEEMALVGILSTQLVAVQLASLNRWENAPKFRVNKLINFSNCGNGKIVYGSFC